MDELNMYLEKKLKSVYISLLRRRTDLRINNNDQDTYIQITIDLTCQKKNTDDENIITQEQIKRRMSRMEERF